MQFTGRAATRNLSLPVGRTDISALTISSIERPSSNTGRNSYILANRVHPDASAIDVVAHSILPYVETPRRRG